VLPEAFVADVERISYASASLKINVALEELPKLQRACPGRKPGALSNRGHHPPLSPTRTTSRRGVRPTPSNGRPSADPVIEFPASLGGGSDSGAGRGST